jgi:hypothetical protein
MLGKLFSQALSGVVSSTPGISTSNSGSATGASSGDDAYDEGFSAGVLPESVLEEADTRALLYGPAAIVPRNNHGGTSGVTEGVRVVVVLDLQCADREVFDSEVCCRDSARRRRASIASGVSNSDSNVAGSDGSNGGGSALSRLTRSLSSAHLSQSGGSTKAHGNIPRRSHRRTSTLSSAMTASSDATCSQQRLSPASTSSSTATVSTGSTAGNVIELPVKRSILKELVFGSTPVLFNGTISKLHPLPDGDTWLATKLFKVSVTEQGSHQALDTMIVDRTKTGSSINFRRGYVAHHTDWSAKKGA